MNAQTYGIIKI